MRRRFYVYGLCLLAMISLVFCGGRRNMVTLKGSDTMVLLGQRWAESYMNGRPGAIVQVTGGGTGTGIAALINGTADITQASRPMKDDEQAQLNQRFGSPAHEILVAKDGLAIYVHDSSPVNELSLEQLRGIYTGAIANWTEVGGPERPIIVYGRENSSGTYEYFKERVLEKGDFDARVQALPGTAAVVNAVAQDPNGIGYGGAAYARGVKEVAVRPDAASPGVLPTQENVQSGAYPISRGLFFYTRKAPQGAIEEFVDYVLSDSGQAIVNSVGYFPIR